MLRALPLKPTKGSAFGNCEPLKRLERNFYLSEISASQLIVGANCVRPLGSLILCVNKFPMFTTSDIVKNDIFFIKSQKMFSEKYSQNSLDISKEKRYILYISFDRERYCGYPVSESCRLVKDSTEPFYKSPLSLSLNIL